jgi:hypothetical protein
MISVLLDSCLVGLMSRLIQGDGDADDVVRALRLGSEQCFPTTACSRAGFFAFFSAVAEGIPVAEVLSDSAAFLDWIELAVTLRHEMLSAAVPDEPPLQALLPSLHSLSFDFIAELVARSGLLHSVELKQRLPSALLDRRLLALLASQ